MKNTIKFLLAGLALAAVSGTASARPNVSIAIGIPSQAPVYVAPPPVYYAPPPPVYYRPAPGYLAPGPVAYPYSGYYAAPRYYEPGYHGRHHGYRHYR